MKSSGPWEASSSCDACVAFTRWTSTARRRRRRRSYQGSYNSVHADAKIGRFGEGRATETTGFVSLRRRAYRNLPQAALAHGVQLLDLPQVRRAVGVLHASVRPNPRGCRCRLDLHGHLPNVSVSFLLPLWVRDALRADQYDQRRPHRRQRADDRSGRDCRDPCEEARREEGKTRASRVRRTIGRQVRVVADGAASGAVNRWRIRVVSWRTVCSSAPWSNSTCRDSATAASASS